MYQIYQVMPNETLEDVARKLGVNIEELRRINGINSNQNIGGSYLIIPTQNDISYEKYTVKKGDNIYSIARKYGISYESLLRLNGLNEADYIYPNQEILIPRSNYEVYVVKEGDTLSEVARNLGRDITDLMNKNNEILLLPDQVIRY